MPGHIKDEEEKLRRKFETKPGIDHIHSTNCNLQYAGISNNLYPRKPQTAHS
jgi:hypothetical protein